MMDYKVVVVGESMVGKSCIVNAFIRNTFLEDSVYIPTIVDFYRKQVECSGENHLLEVIDTGGDEIYKPVTEDQMRKGDGFLCVFGVDDLNSFEQTSTLIRKIQLENPSIVLVGNKCEKQANKLVDYSSGFTQASHFGIPYVETSALWDVNIRKAFLLVLNLMRHSKHVQVSDRNDCNSRQCCPVC